MIRTTCLTVVGAMILGLPMTWLLIQLLRAEAFNRWYPTPALPAPFASFVTIWHTTIHVRTADDHLYALDPTHDRQWVRLSSVPTEDDSGSYRDHIGACDYTAARFRWYTNPPLQQQTCIEARATE